MSVSSFSSSCDVTGASFASSSSGATAACWSMQAECLSGCSASARGLAVFCYHGIQERFPYKAISYYSDFLAHSIPTFWLSSRHSLSAFRISESRPLSHIMLTSSVHMPLAVDTCVFARSYVFPIPAPCQVSCDSGVDTTIPLLGIPYLTPVFRPPVPRRAIVAHLYLRTLVPLPLSLALVSRARRTEDTCCLPTCTRRNMHALS